MISENSVYLFKIALKTKKSILLKRAKQRRHRTFIQSSAKKNRNKSENQDNRKKHISFQTERKQIKTPFSFKNTIPNIKQKWTSLPKKKNKADYYLKRTYKEPRICESAGKFHRKFNPTLNGPKRLTNQAVRSFFKSKLINLPRPLSRYQKPKPACNRLQSAHTWTKRRNLSLQVNSKSNRVKPKVKNPFTPSFSILKKYSFNENVSIYKICSKLFKNHIRRIDPKNPPFKDLVELGRGSYGVVYEARVPSNQAKQVVKKIKLSSFGKVTNLRKLAVRENQAGINFRSKCLFCRKCARFTSLACSTFTWTRNRCTWSWRRPGNTLSGNTCD